ncbi:MAG: hypothetical protein F2780_05710 [Actinobacteria bacterium]|uniref:Unannotated protein n=1 Tax=freshwater metagenome TaxID=449393 RepID=A0A6J7DWH4_9ZZZZ|nr:hypothetical protein [Actinomycetota bacterium]
MEHLIDELAKLQELKEKGTVTAAEFDLMKQDILNRMAAHEASGSIPPPPPPTSFTAPSATFPPTPAPSSSKNGLVAAVVVLVLVGAGVGAWLVVGNSDSKPRTINVSYTDEVVTTDFCAGFAETGYSDIPFAEAEIVDGGGNLLGFGSLDGGVDLNESCVFSAEFTVDESSDGKYRATAGNTNRGYINYTEADIVDGTLTIDAIIGD